VINDGLPGVSLGNSSATNQGSEKRFPYLLANVPLMYYVARRARGRADDRDRRRA